MATKIVTCNSCGTQNTGLENFCRNCGSNLAEPFQQQDYQNQQMQQPYNQNANTSTDQVSHFPSQLKTVAIIQLVAGILEVIVGLISGFYVILFGLLTFGIGLFFIFIPIIFLAVGICSIISALNGMNEKSSYGFTLSVAIAQMCMLFMCDFVSFACGLAEVIFLMNDEVKAYFK